jgi:hypothetical protein
MHVLGALVSTGVGDVMFICLPVGIIPTPQKVIWPAGEVKKLAS